MKLRSLLALGMFCLPTCQSEGVFDRPQDELDQEELNGEESEQEVPRGTSVISSALLGSCNPSDCGGESSNGDGWCDNTCANWGDCAEDAGDVCGFDECLDDQSCDRNQTCADTGSFLECEDVPVAPRAACDDRIDNDGDGRVDYPDDPGCTSSFDDDETDLAQTPACSDGLDNDGDGLVDFPEDPGCGNRFDPIDEDPPTTTPFSSLCGPLPPGVIEITEKETYGYIEYGDRFRPAKYRIAVPYSIENVVRTVESDAGLWENSFPEWSQFQNFLHFDDSEPFMKFRIATVWQDSYEPSARCWEVEIDRYVNEGTFDFNASEVPSTYSYPTDGASFKLTIDLTASHFAYCGGDFSPEEISSSEMHEDCLCVDNHCIHPYQRRSCSNGIDDDGDGFVDFPEEPGCENVRDDDESDNPECSDGIDNDGDGQIDAGNDSDCDDIYDDSEFTPTQFECEDGIDNDGDGRVDLDDSDCRSSFDNSESQ